MRVVSWMIKKQRNGVAPLVRTGGSRHTGLAACRTVIFSHAFRESRFNVFEQVFEVISNARSSIIKFLGEEMIDKIISILNDETMEPEERAKQLLGME